MSDLIVSPTRVTSTAQHHNADALSLITVKGWQVVTAKDQFKEGDIVIHIPPDAMVPWELAHIWGVEKYLSGYEKRGTPGEYEKAGRVKAIRLKGEVSHGFVVSNDNSFKEGIDIKDELGIFKYEPPEDYKFVAGNIEKPHPLLQTYTDIQNHRNFADVFFNDEIVVATEKVHGTNSVVGLIHENNERILMIGSRKNRRKIGQGSIYELPIKIYDGLPMMLNSIMDTDSSIESVICYGELYGWVQDLRYGHSTGEISYISFDISVNGRYIDHFAFSYWANEFAIPMAPIVYDAGPYCYDQLLKLSSGKTRLMESDPHIMEGIVVKPLIERTDPKLGRVILKLISDEYLTRKKGTEYH